jgi:hypothetical protein
LQQWEYYQLLRVFRRLIARRNRARGRGPPRASPAGVWLVLDSSVAVSTFHKLFTVGELAADDAAESIGMPQSVAALAAAHRLGEPMPMVAP